MKTSFFVLLLLKLNIVYSQCDFQIGVQFPSKFPDTIKINLTKTGLIETNSSEIKIFLFNKIKCRLGIQNVRNSNIGFQLEVKGKQGYVLDSICDDKVGSILMPENGLKTNYSYDEVISQNTIFPPSCIYVHDTGEFRVKYFFKYWINGISQKLETPWFYFYLQRND
ncbi:MAG TPA: hypothetical protein PKC62_03620 [Ferruginibacter sp.]|jgi:hypothetical protein|nr:hypothetical protein [Ferruginibacter sp.]MBS1910117.1 hypothetical protein [Bacteroidota bacterium]MBS1926146.1 hypothetical protein [Bacteroidota bacterium]HMT95754.1 hypothetical protein [Ferruginibacter sp.]HMU24748.1 hypothetical protein [Ferruginibacter sp.]